MCADIPPQIYIFLAKIAISLTVELFCICCVVTLTAFKQDWEPTVTGRLEIAIDNLCFPLPSYNVNRKNSQEGGSHFKDQE